ncbi:hypothetical protein ACFQZE_04295 [Paenibacillus sp. GCM10027627]
MLKKTVFYNKEVAGYIASFEMFGEQTVGYWIGRKYWENGIATSGLSQFLLVCQQIRPFTLARLRTIRLPFAYWKNAVSAL